MSNRISAWFQRLPHLSKRRHRTYGQSFVELCLAMPVILLMIGGLAEVAFFINDYLDLLDASREGARYGTNLVYTTTYLDPSGNCKENTTHFFYVVGCLTEDNILRVGGMKFDTAEDDIVISVFALQDQANNDTGVVVTARFPNESNGWSYATGNASVGCGGACPSKFTDMPGDTTPGPLVQALRSVTSLNPTGSTTYGDLNNAVLVVEVFYNHYQRLNLPLFNFLPNPIRTYAYSIFPEPSAEPTATTPP